MSIKKQQPESNFMVISFGMRYDDSLVLPYKEGIAVLSALENARIYKKSYSDPSIIKDVSNTDITTSSIGSQEYGEAILRSTLLAEETSK